MTFPLSLSQSEYETIVEFGRRGTLNSDGTVNQDSALAFNSWLEALERRNGIERSFVWVQWQEQNAPLPPGTVFPNKWPPEMRAYIALVSRPVALVDVEAVLEKQARNPTAVLVTRDPAASVGWTELNVYFK